MRRWKAANKALRKIAPGVIALLLAVVVVTIVCSSQPVEADPSNVIATYGEGYLEDVNGLLVLHVKGSPYEMGYQHGFLLRDKVKAAIQLVTQYWINITGYSYEYFVTCAQAMEPYIPQEYMQEMQGLADGANISYIDVLVHQAMHDIRMAGGCSGFVVFGNATVDGHLYHGRNGDLGFPPEIRPLQTGRVTVYEPENGNAYVTFGGFGYIWTYGGMNSKGITVGHSGSTSTDVTLNGTPFGLMLKQVLQYSSNITEAIDIICQTPRTTGRNILLGDSRNLNAAAVEISANYSKVFWPGDPAEDIEPHYSIPNAVRRANHYVDPELAATQRSPYDPRLYDPRYGWGYSWLRYEKLSELIEDNYGNIGAEKAMEFMRTPPVAWYPINSWCTLFDSTDLELWVAWANSTTPAYLRGFVHLSHNDLFPQYTLVISSTAGGNVTSPGVGTFVYETGTVVSLNATPDTGYRFVNWTGNVSTIGNVTALSTNITMSGNYSITANFEEEEPPMTPQTGCFIATAAYGTPMAEEIQILREFRDQYLLANSLGQGLIDVYYRIGPPIADFITDHPSLKPIARAGLVPIVAMCSIVLDIVPQFTGNNV